MQKFGCRCLWASATMTTSTTSTTDSSRCCDGEDQVHRGMLIQAGVCEALMLAMAQSGEHREVAYYSAAAASAMAEGGDDAALEAKARLVDLPSGPSPSSAPDQGVCSLLQMHGDSSPEVAEVCCAAIANLASSSAANGARFVCADAPRLVVAAMDKHSPDHAAVAMQGCRAIWVPTLSIQPLIPL